MAESTSVIQEIKALLGKNEVDGVRKYFKSRRERAMEYIRQYDIANHEVMKRRDKYIPPKYGDNNELIAPERYVKQWRLPVPYQKKIVNSSVAFLFGKPINLIQNSKNTEEAFEALDDGWRKMRLDSMNRELARFLFRETEVARLYYFDNDDPKKPRVKCMHLANSLNDKLYTLFDTFNEMKAFAREYTSQVGDRTTSHFDLYMADTIYYCTREQSAGGYWNTDARPNKIKKIPVVYYEQPEAEWADVQPMIERLEWLASTRGDVNDATADPILILEGQVLSLPDRQETAKVVILDVGGKASYLHPQMSVEMVRDERMNLKQQIHYCTDTPDLSMDAVGGVDGRSGEAIKMLFFSSNLKALTKQEIFEPMLDREISIQRAFYKEFIYPDIADQFDKLEVTIEFGSVMPDNPIDTVEMLSRAVQAEILSKDSANKILSGVLHIDEEKESLLLEDEQKEAAMIEGGEQPNPFMSNPKPKPPLTQLPKSA